MPITNPVRGTQSPHVSDPIRWYDGAPGGGGDVTDITTTTGAEGQYLRVATAGGLEYLNPADVLIDLGESAGTPSDGDILVFRNAGPGWVLEAKPAGGSNPAMGDITDVTLSMAVDDDLLVYDSGQWVNKDFATAGIAPTVHTHSASQITSGTFDNARISEASVTQHEGALTITEAQISDLGTYLTSVALNDVTDVVITGPIADNEVLAWDTGTSRWINQTLAEAAIAAAVHSHAASDITSGTLADARVAQSNVTQHQAALSITESQISDFGSYESALGNPAGNGYVLSSTTGGSRSWVNPSSLTVGDADTVDGQHASAFAAAIHVHAASDITSGTFADARISQSSVTQHQAALTITESQISDLGTYLTSVALDDITDVVITGPVADNEILAWDTTTSRWINQTPAEAAIATAVHVHAASDITSGTFDDARISSSSVTQHQAALTITESQISDLGSYLTSVALNDITDVVISGTPADNEVLAWNTATSRWINQTAGEAGLAASTHVHAAGDITSGTFADARVAQTNVTQHQAALSITESQISDFGTYEDALGNPASDGYVLSSTAAGVRSWIDPSSFGGVANLDDLTDVVITGTPADNEVLAWDTSTSKWINQTAAEASLAAAVHVHAASDITSGTFADARIAQTNVTQHQAALSITESQISDLGTYEDALGNPASDGYLLSSTAAGVRSWVDPSSFGGVANLGDLTDVVITGTPADNEVLAWDTSTSKWINQTAAEASLAAAVHVHAASDVTSGTFADARISESSVTQHEAALTITESQISDLGSYLTSVALNDVTDVVITGTPADNEILAWDTSTSRWINQTAAEAALAALVHSHAASDITSGTLDNARVAESNVTQHEAALTITESQISDLGSYLTSVALNDVTDVVITGTPADNEVLAWDTGTSRWINQTASEAGLAAVTHVHAAGDITSGTFADARIAASNVTQHQAALTITESQISDLGSYLTSVALNDVTDVVITGTPADNEVLAWDTSTSRWINQTASEAALAAAVHVHAAGDITSGTFADALVAASNVTQHQAALTITESQISDLGSYLTTSAGLNDLSDVSIGGFLSDNQVLAWDAGLSTWKEQTLAEIGAAADGHDHTQYFLLAGTAGGITANGGLVAGDDLILDSTAHATKGDVIIQPSGGNVGIGITSPAELLHIEATAGFNVKLAVGTGNEATVFARGTGSDTSYRNLKFIGNQITFRTATASEGTASADRMFIANATGRVGIGTTSPSVPLHVSSSDSELLRVTRTGATAAGDLALVRGTNLGGTGLTGGSVYAADNLVNSVGTAFAVAVASSPMVYVDSSDVVIGSTTSLASSGKRLSIVSSSGWAGINMGTDANNRTWFLWHGTSKYLTIGTRESGTSYNAIYIKGGQVGMYTTTPHSALTVAGNITPNVDNSTDIGEASYRWDDVYATNGTIQTSDAREKTEIKTADLGLDFLMRIRPVSFKRRGGSRTHYGMIAQQIESILGGKDFAGLIYDEKSDRYGLRYDEFVAILIKSVQELTTRVQQLEALV